jgi:hypothetical protein
MIALTGITDPGWDPLGQLDRLEGANHIVGAFILEETLVKARAQIPMVTFVIIVAIKSPDAADDDETTDAVVPEIAEKMEAEIRASERAFKSDVIVNDQLRQSRVMDRMRVTGLARTRVITQRAAFPFRIDDTAILWRQLGFGYLSHKGRRI